MATSQNIGKMTAVELAREFNRLRHLQRDLRIYQERYGDVCTIGLLREHVLLAMKKLSKLIYYSAHILLILTFSFPALAQINHHLDHGNYKNWVNQAGRECCNNQDCGKLPEVNERTGIDGRIEVRIGETWCPILKHHYLKSGNAPDWSTSHVCVLKAVPWQIISPCDRLLCYQPKPSF